MSEASDFRRGASHGDAQSTHSRGFRTDHKDFASRQSTKSRFVAKTPLQKSLDIIQSLLLTDIPAAQKEQLRTLLALLTSKQDLNEVDYGALVGFSTLDPALQDDTGIYTYQSQQSHPYDVAGGGERRGVAAVLPSPLPSRSPLEGSGGERRGEVPSVAPPPSSAFSSFLSMLCCRPKPLPPVPPKLHYYVRDMQSSEPAEGSPLPDSVVVQYQASSEARSLESHSAKPGVHRVQASVSGGMMTTDYAESEGASQHRNGPQRPLSTDALSSKARTASSGDGTAVADLDEDTKQWLASELQTKRARFTRQAPLARSIVPIESFMVQGGKVTTKAVHTSAALEAALSDEHGVVDCVSTHSEVQDHASIGGRSSATDAGAIKKLEYHSPGAGNGPASRAATSLGVPSLLCAVVEEASDDAIDDGSGRRRGGTVTGRLIQLAVPGTVENRSASSPTQHDHGPTLSGEVSNFISLARENHMNGRDSVGLSARASPPTTSRSSSSALQGPTLSFHRGAARDMGTLPSARSHIGGDVEKSQMDEDRADALPVGLLPQAAFMTVGGGIPDGEVTISSAGSVCVDDQHAPSALPPSGKRRHSYSGPSARGGDNAQGALFQSPAPHALAAGHRPTRRRSTPHTQTDAVASTTVVSNVQTKGTVDTADSTAPKPSDPVDTFYVNPNCLALLSAQSELQAASGEYLRTRLNAISRLRGGSTRPERTLGHASSWRAYREAPGLIGEEERGLTSRTASHGSLISGSGPEGRLHRKAASSASLTSAGRGHSPASTFGATSRITPSSEDDSGAAGIVERLRIVTQWEFDVFEFCSKCDNRPLAFICFELFSRLHFFDQLGVSETVFTSLVNRIERDYCFDPARPNPYHTNVHAADVVQAVGHFLIVPRVARIVDQYNAFAIIIAAMIHDFRHPGVNNTFLIKTGDPIAVRYNDESVLENFHSAEAFAVMHQAKYNIMADFLPEQRNACRFTIIKTILATDLAQGQKYVNAFKAKSGVATLGQSDEDRLLVLQMMIKCADVSHPARQWKVHERWSNLVTEEFYRQGDMERELRLPISPLCDRTAHNLPKSQLGFINFVVAGAFQSFSDFCGVDTWMVQLKANEARWKELAAAGSTTSTMPASLADASLVSPPRVYGQPGQDKEKSAHSSPSSVTTDFSPVKVVSPDRY